MEIVFSDMNWKKLLILALVLTVAVAEEEEAVVEGSTYGDDLPHLRGERYVKILNYENLEENTRDRPNGSPALLFVGASWCPHCRTFKPKYNIIADTLHDREAGAGIKPECMYYEATQDKDPIAKKFKLSGYPAVILFKRNKIWKYDGTKEVESVIEWMDNPNEILAESYPDYIPGFVDDFMDGMGELYNNLRAAYHKDPSSMIYLGGGVALVMLAFLVCFLYALFASCCSKQEADKSKDE